jgi:hypothetical protein
MTRRRPGCLAGAAVAVVAASVAVVLLLPPLALRLTVPPGDGRVVRGSLHVHTVRSDGAGTVDDVARAARAAGLDFVVVTDHGDATRTPDAPAYRAGVLVIDAVEISTTGGHYVALGLGAAPYRLAGEPRDVVEDVARLGGFGIAAHPDSPKRELRWEGWDTGIDGVEWLNADSEWRDEGGAALARAFATYWIRSPETIASLFDRGDPVFAAWDRLTRTRRVVAVAGHDAHARIGLSGGAEPDESDIVLRLPGYETAFRTFGVRARLERPLTRDAGADARLLLDAIRAGHAFTVVDAIAGPAMLDFTAAGESRTASMGDELDETGPVKLQASVTPVPGVRLALVKDGQVVERADGGELRYEHPGGLGRSVYRVEATIDGRTTPWVVGNPIYVGRLPDAFLDATVAIVATEPLSMQPQANDWRVEHEARSAGTLAAGEGGTLRFEWRLGDGLASGQFAAAVRPLPEGRVREWDRVAFEAAAARPMRVSVQVRTPGGERWIRSAYVDATTRTVAVRFDDMRPAEPGIQAAPRLDQVDSLLVVVDTVNTQTGKAGNLVLGHARLERLTR